MVIKVYVSTISFSQEIKKNQQRTLMILESKNVPFVTIDITDPGQEDSKDYMNETARPKGNNKVPMTPQIFNDADYCGDFDDLDMANECDTLGDFLKMTDEQKKDIKIGITSLVPGDEKSKDSQPLTNGVSTSRENSQEKKPAAEESKELEGNALEEVNEVPPVSTDAPAETAIEEEEQKGDSQDQLETKDIDGEVETEKANEEVNDDVIATGETEAVADAVKEEEEEEEEDGEEEEEEEEKEKDQRVQNTSA